MTAGECFLTEERLVLVAAVCAVPGPVTQQLGPEAQQPTPQPAAALSGSLPVLGTLEAGSWRPSLVASSCLEVSVCGQKLGFLFLLT